MPIIKSAKKAARQAEKRTEHNKEIKKDIKGCLARYSTMVLSADKGAIINKF